METIIQNISVQEYLTPKAHINIINPEGYLICIQFSFDATLQFNQQKYQVTSGQIVIANSIKILNSTQNLGKYRIIFFDSDFNFFKHKIRLIQLKEYDRTQQQHIHKFKKSFDNFEQIPHIDHLSQLEGSLNSLIFELNESLKENLFSNKVIANPIIALKKFDIRLLLIHRYIRKNYNKPLTLSYLASLIKSNPVYLSNTFSKVFRISPMKFLQSVRMKKALEFLNTNMSVKNVAHAIGYISTSQFSEVFKRYYKQTPQEYRKNRIISDYFT